MTELTLKQIGQVSNERILQTLERQKLELDLTLSTYRIQQTAKMAAMSSREAHTVMASLLDTSKTVLALIDNLEKAISTFSFETPFEEEPATNPPTEEETSPPNSLAEALEAGDTPYMERPHDDDENDPVIQEALDAAKGPEEAETPPDTKEDEEAPEATSEAAPVPLNGGAQRKLGFPPAPIDPSPVPALPQIPNLANPQLSLRTMSLAERCRMAESRKAQSYYIDSFLRDGDFIFHLFLRDDSLTSHQVFEILDHEWFHGRLQGSTFRKKDVGATFRRLRTAGLLETREGKNKTLYTTEKGRTLLNDFHSNEYDPYKEDRTPMPPAPESDPDILEA